jgi:hypothetical protein
MKNVFLFYLLFVVSNVIFAQSVTTIEDINVVVNNEEYKRESFWTQKITDASDFYILRNMPIFEHILGYDSVICSHPLTSESPAIFRVNVSGKSTLSFDVHSHPIGNCKLEIWAGKQRLFEKNIDTKRWKEITINIPYGTQEIELLHYATGWNFEFLYYHFNK